MRFFAKLFLIFCLLPASSFAFSSRNLTVIAEPNMMVAMTKIAREFSKMTNSVVAVNFTVSQDIVDDIDSGEPIDVLVSDNSELIDSLKHRGVVDVHSAGYIAGDRLVLVANHEGDFLFSDIKKMPSIEASLQALDRNGSSLLIDHSESPSGRASNELLRILRLPKDSVVGLKLFRKISEDRSAMLNVVRKSSAYYALLLSSQVASEKDFSILSKSSESDTFYQALVIAGEQMELSRKFVKFLKGDYAKKILMETGFDVLGNQRSFLN